MDNRVISEIIQKINEFEKEEFTTESLCEKRAEIINIINRFIEKVTAENLSENETHYMVSPLRYIIDKRYGSKDDVLNEETFEMNDNSDMPECKSAEEAIQQIELQSARMKKAISEAKFTINVGRILLLPDTTLRLLGKLEEVVQELEENNKDSNIWTDNDIEYDFIWEIGCTTEHINQFEELMEEVFPEFDEFLGR